jgi:hypothetical protein
MIANRNCCILCDTFVCFGVGNIWCKANLLVTLITFRIIEINPETTMQYFMLYSNLNVIIDEVIKLDFKLIVSRLETGSSSLSVLNGCFKLCKPKMIHTQLLIMNEIFYGLKYLAASLACCLMSIFSKHQRKMLHIIFVLNAVLLCEPCSWSDSKDLDIRVVKGGYFWITYSLVHVCMSCVYYSY